MNGPFRLDATGWSPVGTLVGGEPGVVDKPRRGPSIAFAVSVIALVAVATAGTVHLFFSSETDAAVAEQAVVAEQTVVVEQSVSPVQRPVVIASLSDMLPVDSESDATPNPAADRFAPDIQDPLADIDAPDPQDPRWARAADDLVPPPAVAASVAAVVPSADAAPEQPQQAGHTDVTETAAIAPEEEASPQRAAEPEQPATDDAAVADDPMSLVTRARPAQVSRAVNLRARPKSGSQKLMVIPRGASVQLVGCKVWCEVVYKGRHGYVYKDFLGGMRSATAAGKPKAVKTAQARRARPGRARPRRARPSRSIPARPISRACPAWMCRRSSRFRPGCNDQDVADRDQRQPGDRVGRPGIAFERRRNQQRKHRKHHRRIAGPRRADTAEQRQIGAEGNDRRHDGQKDQRAEIGKRRLDDERLAEQQRQKASPRVP